MRYRALGLMFGLGIFEADGDVVVFVALEDTVVVRINALEL